MKLILKKPIKILIISSILVLMFIGIGTHPKLARIIYYPVCKNVMNDVFIWKCSDYKCLEGNHTRIYYCTNDMDYIRNIMDYAEDSIYILSGKYGFKPTQKVDIIVYKKYDDMAQMMALGTGSPALGAYYCNTIGLMGPGKYGSSEDIESLLLHELTHYMLDLRTRGNIPAWFTEGVALYEEYDVYNTIWDADEKFSDYYSLDELSGNFYGLDEVKAYKESFMIVKHIVDNYGTASISKISSELKAGKSFDQAALKILHKDMEHIFYESLRGE